MTAVFLSDFPSITVLFMSGHTGLAMGILGDEIKRELNYG